MDSSNHPLPAPSGGQRPGQQRPRAKSGFSFHSHKSSGSADNGKLKLVESHGEKEANRLHSKADPSMALSEAEPSEIANDFRSSLQSIRGIQHRDSQGIPIADPDRSNPTRNRWERPLDTIRAFEAAIDGNYRKSYIHSDSSDIQSNYNRRSSYYGGTQVSHDDRPRYIPNAGRSMSYTPRPESTYGYNRPGRESYYGSGDGTPYNAAGPSNGYYPNRARYPRTASEPQFNNGVYPSPGNQQSYETVTTASGSGSDPIGYSTDPSSENSSVDRIAPQVPIKEPQETYGFNGFGTTPQFAPQANGMNGQRGPHGYVEQQGPPPPRKLGKSSPSQPMKLGDTSGNVGPPPTQRPDVGEKRKSWFGKRFSKSK
ncbi:hypothetical protein GLAREA_00835 [Glarea lozoyensis ATCC 20868]|uniref:DUF2406 domain-containing protein n=1 Tax=Glarea lozoyensis (strain ATCC 20868 / MF5171) TaxID=1116229 RepID=S3CVJ5_GLAL2|nr:uncharacterized protein GLAREA_00835 [Glarea lozoyensis ATCC 20868]EPE29675.1 hypothetical protein GLAREA_00835 [Glarea lozoyensis ATCC 20868]